MKNKNIFKDKDVLNEIDETTKVILNDKYLTALKKAEFIKELKLGLGEEIKANPKSIKIIKIPRYQRFKLFLIKLFTKF